ncbi:MAG: MgtC/SapB family protein [Lachnospiraceae bacterium]|nr:MgtC/SapB family protein [Lachnospiraceae bacterium]
MEQIRSAFEYLQSFNTVTLVIRLLLAVVAGGVIGGERGRHGRAAGLRTHILVCLGGAMTSLCSLYVSQINGLPGDVFRISASVISGIGFLGAGIILVKNNSTVAGLTTAAGMWVTATIGVAFGYGFYVGAVIATVICVINAALLTKVEHKRKQPVRFYIEIDDLSKIQGVLDHIGTILEQDMLIETVSAKSGIIGRIGFVVSTSYKRNYDEIQKALDEIDGISFVVEE